MADKYEGQATGLTSPGIDALPVAPNDTVPLAHVTRALYVGVSGDVRVELLSGAVATFQSMQAGGIYPLRVSRVFATGTTASGLIGVC